MISVHCYAWIEPLKQLQLEVMGGLSNLVITSCYLAISLLIGFKVWCNRKAGLDVFVAIAAGVLWGGSWEHAVHAVAAFGVEPSWVWQTVFDSMAVLPAIAVLGVWRRPILLLESPETLPETFKVQQELEQRNRELEQKIEYRTKELTERNQHLQVALTELKQMHLHLVQTEKMSMLGQMVAGISHEINNPVNFIHGNIPYIESYVKDLLSILHAYEASDLPKTKALETTLEEIDTHFIAQDLPRIVSSMRLGTDRIRDLVLNLRNFYRLDEVEMKPSDIQSGIESTLLLLHHRYKQKIDIVQHFGEVPLVECHINQLNQVFMNLISNSIDALLEEELGSCSLVPHASSRSPGTKQIVITTELLSTNRVVIRISDNGPGIPPEVQERLFEPFFTTKPMGIGTGLGLSISHQIVTQTHQGRIYCCSALGEGTSFVIELPLRQSKARFKSVESKPVE